MPTPRRKLMALRSAGELCAIRPDRTRDNYLPAQNKNRYGRTVATCFKGTEDLNRWMVANGWAVAYRQYSRAYIADEDAARRSQVNIWGGPFDMPWDWRARRRN